MAMADPGHNGQAVQIAGKLRGELRPIPGGGALLVPHSFLADDGVVFVFGQQAMFVSAPPPSRVVDLHRG
jgi:hypothetical protein